MKIAANNSGPKDTTVPRQNKTTKRSFWGHYEELTHK